MKFMWYNKTINKKTFMKWEQTNICLFNINVKGF